MCKPISELVLRNRKAGPFGILKLIDERCGGIFENISDVISSDELNNFMSSYKKAAGFAKDELNNAAPIIPNKKYIY